MDLVSGRQKVGKKIFPELWSGAGCPEKWLPLSSKDSKKEGWSPVLILSQLLTNWQLSLDAVMPLPLCGGLHLTYTPRLSFSDCTIWYYNSIYRFLPLLKNNFLFYFYFFKNLSDQLRDTSYTTSAQSWYSWKERRVPRSPFSPRILLLFAPFIRPPLFC